MKSYTLYKINNIASIALSSMALVMGLILTPLIKVLPEAIGLPLFIILLPCTIIFASLGIIFGGLSLTDEQKSPRFVGILVGCLAFLTTIIQLYR